MTDSINLPWAESPPEVRWGCSARSGTFQSQSPAAGQRHGERDCNACGLPEGDATDPLLAAGGHPRQLTGTTDPAGFVTLSYVGTQSGVTDTLQAQAAFGTTTLVSSVLTAAWNTGTNTAPVVVSGGDQAITYPNPVSADETSRCPEIRNLRFRAHRCELPATP